MADLPSPKDSLLARYTGEAFKVLRDQVAAPHIAVARTLLGQLRNRLALGGIAAGAHSVTLPDGTRIKVGVYGAINKMWIDPPSEDGSVRKEIVVRLAFLAYEKWFYSPGGDSAVTHGYPYGYSMHGETKLARDKPYIVGEPETWPVGWIDGIVWRNSITEVRFVPGKTEVKVFEGKNFRYGNQYYCDGKNVWSWWHSPFGDLPWLEFDTLAQFYSSNMRYMPAFVVQDNLGFLYQTEIPEIPMRVPLDIYRNGQRFAVCPGFDGYAMVSGMGRHAESGLYLIARCGYSTIDLLTLDGTTTGLVGQLVATEATASYPVRFNSTGTRCTTLGSIKDSADRTTLHWLEWKIERDPETGAFSFERVRAIPYYSTRTLHDYATATFYDNDALPPPAPVRGTITNGNTDDRQATIDSHRDDSTSFLCPVAAYYDASDTAQVAVIDHEYLYSQTHEWIDKEYYAWVAWDNMFEYFFWFSENKESHEFYQHTTIKASYLTTATLRFDGRSVPIHSMSDVYTYRIFTDELIQDASSRFTSFSFTACPNGATSCNYVQTLITDTSIGQEAEDSETISGFTSQLRFLDARNGVCSLVKTSYSARYGRDFDQVEETNRHDTNTVNYFGCPEPEYFSESNQRTDYHAEYTKLEDESKKNTNDNSEARFYTLTPGIGLTSVGDAFVLVSGTTEGSPVVSAEANRQYTNTGGYTGDTLEYYNSVTEMNTVIAPPVWVTGPLVSQYTNETVDTSTSTTGTLDDSYIRSLLLREFHGSGSLRSDATQSASGGNIESLLTGKDDTPWRYIFNEAGYFTTPDYTFYPGSVEARGGEFANVFDTSLDWTPSAVPDPQSQYPIGFYMTEIEA